jgi:predicted N-acetyltransferase YhbS
VAIWEDQPVGTISLKNREVWERPDFPFWLGALLVPAAERGQGIGRVLVKGAEAAAVQMAIDELHLYTRSRASFHAELGWSVRETLVVRGRPATIMMRRLGEADRL